MFDNCLLRKLVPDKVYLVRLVVIFLLRALAEARLFRMAAIYAPNAKLTISKKGLIDLSSSHVRTPHYSLFLAKDTVRTGQVFLGFNIPLRYKEVVLFMDR